MRAFKAHEAWSSRTAFLLAAIGAAVGLGNIWKFPYMAGAHGGSAFVLVYLLSIALIALPILVAEIALGRMGRQSPPHALGIVARRHGRSSAWSLVGWLGLLAAYLIATYYSVIAGWTMVYVYRSAAGDLVGIDSRTATAAFDALLASPVQMTAWHGGFMLITAAILTRGLKHGIEKTVMVLMPALFILLLVLVVYSAIEGDMPAALRFLFQFDLAAIDGKVVLMAIGQAFFSIGVAMGLMLGFGAYLNERISIARSAVIIVGADTLVAVLAGVAIFPIVFANGLNPSEGPGLVFVSLPIAFAQMTGGLVFGTLFFLLLWVAALTSMIGVLEPMVCWLVEASGLGRRPAAGIVCASIFVLGLGTVFSFNLWSQWHPLGFLERFSSASLFAVLDYLTANVMMPLGGLLLALFAGWILPRAEMATQSGITSRGLFSAWYQLLRWLVPPAIVAIFVSNL